MDSDNPNLYISSVYTKNSGQAQADIDFDNILLRFSTASKNIKEAFMNRWTKNLDSILNDKSLFEDLNLMEYESEILNEEEGFKDGYLGNEFNINKAQSRYSTGYLNGEEAAREYIDNDTWELIKAKRYK